MCCWSRTSAAARRRAFLASKNCGLQFTGQRDNEVYRKSSSTKKAITISINPVFMSHENLISFFAQCVVGLGRQPRAAAHFWPRKIVGRLSSVVHSSEGSPSLQHELHTRTENARTYVQVVDVAIVRARTWAHYTQRN